MGAEKAHAYVPRTLHYWPGTLSQSNFIGIYCIASVLVVSLVWIFSGRSRSKIDRMLMCWWAFTGLTHIILEGYFVFSPDFFKYKTGFHQAQVWEENSKSDSRYEARTAGVVAVEGVTAVFMARASLLAVYAIATEKSYSHVLQLAVCLGQLYGVAVYSITSYFEGDNFATNSFNHYAYYVGVNAYWVVIPLFIASRSCKKICAAFQVQNQKKTKTR